MRILYIARALDDAGSFFVLKGLFTVLARRGHEVFVQVLEGSRVAVPFPELAERFERASTAPAAASARPAKAGRPSLRRRLFELAPASKILLYDGLRSLRPQREAIRTLRPDLIVDRDNWTTVLLARRAGIPCVTHWDGLFESESEFGRKAHWDFRLWLPVARAVLRRFGQHYAVVTPAVRDHHLKLGFRPERFTVLDNGVDTERFRPDVARHPIAEQLRGKLVLGFVGSFRPWHRVDELLGFLPSLLEHHPNVVSLFAGSGPEWHKVEALARDPRVAGHVHLLGRVPHEEIPSVIACFDVGLLPFTTYSCSPLKMYEYMAMGKATVAPAYESVLRVIEDGVDGITFVPDDQDSLRAALRRAVEDPQRTRAIGAAARRKVVEHFTWEHVADRFEAAWRSVGAGG